MQLGPVRKWKRGDILYAENDVVRMAYVANPDLTKLGQMGWHDGICVEYISPETAKLWDTGEGTEMVPPKLEI